MLVSGLFQAGVLTVLKLSPRICQDSRSPILNERKTDKLISHEPGPAIAFGPRLPKVRFAGCPKQFVVIAAVQTVGSNHGALSPLPFGVAMLSPKWFSVLLFPGARSTPALPPKLSRLPVRMDSDPFICHPPSTAAAVRFPLPQRLPLPNGNS